MVTTAGASMCFFCCQNRPIQLFTVRNLPGMK